jgi:hypothetical protein
MSILNFIKNYFPKNILKHSLLLMIFALLFGGCKKDDDGTLGLSVYNGNVLNVNVSNFENLELFPFKEDSISTDDRSKVLVGGYYDPVFGKVKAEFAAQFLLNSFNVDFGTNPQVDSVKLRLKCVGYYGTDTTTLQTFKVYKLAQELDKDSVYYSNTDMSLMADLTSPVGEVAVAFEPNSGYLEIPLNLSLGDELLGDTSIYSDNETFTQAFKGLYVQAEDVSTGGAVYYFSPLVDDGVVLTVYFHNDSLDTLSYNYYVTQKSAYFNLFYHDYIGTQVEAYMQDSIVSDSFVYVQAAGGIKSVVDLSPLLTFRDSGTVGVNKAELILKVDTNQNYGLEPPERLLLEIVDDNDDFDAPVDYWMNNYYFNGYYDATNGQYRFVITQYAQELLKGIQTNTKLKIFPEATKTIVRRVVLKNDLELKVVYTNF